MSVSSERAARALKLFDAARVEGPPGEQRLRAMQKVLEDQEAGAVLVVTVTKCQARQYGDQMQCGRCGLSWDTNDPERPECSSTERRVKDRPAAAPADAWIDDYGHVKMRLGLVPFAGMRLYVQPWVQIGPSRVSLAAVDGPTLRDCYLSVEAPDGRASLVKFVRDAD